ncbi:MAG: TIGR03086 family metal-binding protein [Acidimicrobiales bacterium]|nr:TIGR03086 family metal-binding protein [Acidimicrobiales bacterium]|tara:strand:- start:1266 stop:1886 length:621 start_codon:yes stop_codon:yes gene_type:complete
MANSPDPLRMLDLSQSRSAAVISTVTENQMSLPTPCDLWDVKDIINKLIASTRLFAGFGLRQPADPSLDLINPKDLFEGDPTGAYLAAAKECRDAWRCPGALDGLATSTIGEAKAKAVLNARIFDTTILTWDISQACGIHHLIDEEQASYVLYVAERLVPAVRSQSPERYKDQVLQEGEVSTVNKLIGITGRDPTWKAKLTEFKKS